MKFADVMRMKRPGEEAVAVASHPQELATDADSHAPELATRVASDGYPPPAPVARKLDFAVASHAQQLATKMDSHTAKRKPQRNARLTQLNVRIDKDLKAKIDILSGAEGKGVAAIVEEALRLWLATGVARKLATFDSDDDLTDDIIKLYARLTGKMMTTADRDAYTGVKGLNANAIKIGMYTTIFHAKGGPINSFKYFLPEIHKAAAGIGNIGSPEEYVAHLRSRVKKEFGRG